MFNQNYHNIVFEVTNKILEQQKKSRNLFCLVSGPQGSGKTTFAGIIKEELIKKKLKVLVLSIDDFYLSKKDRLQLSKKISPLFITRGVPGTHNLNFLKKVLNIFFSNKCG